MNSILLILNLTISVGILALVTICCRRTDSACKLVDLMIDNLKAATRLTKRRDSELVAQRYYVLSRAIEGDADARELIEDAVHGRFGIVEDGREQETAALLVQASADRREARLRRLAETDNIETLRRVLIDEVHGEEFMQIIKQLPDEEAKP